MTIAFSCECGKTLRVKDDLAGRRVRCPECQEILTVPEEAQGGIQSPAAARERSTAPPPLPPRRRAESEDVELPLPGSRARLQADDGDMRRRYDPEEDDDRPRRRRRAEEDDDPPEDRPRSRRRLAEEDEDPPEDRPRKRRRSSSAGGGPNWAAVGIGALMMLGAVVWFVAGLLADIIFFYPPVLFILGIIALVRGLIGQES